MLCQNCNENEANIKYTQIINGVKKQMNLCECCAEKLGLNNISFSMPIDMFNFMENIFTDNLFEPQMSNRKTLFDEVFENGFRSLPSFTIENNKKVSEIDSEMDTLVKKLNKQRIENKNNKENQEKDSKEKNTLNDDKKIKIKDLQKRLELEIKEERYEDAAKTRDEIKKLNN